MNTRSKLFKLTLGHRLNGYVMKTLKCPLLEDCAFLCAATDGCRAVSFRKTTQDCTFHNMGLANDIVKMKALAANNQYDYISIDWGC